VLYRAQWSDVDSDQVRCALSIVAAAAGVFIAIHQRHFTLELDQPHSFYVMTTHRCGLVMMSAIAWMATECLALALVRRSAAGASESGAFTIR
jgi:hypothetical protein